MVADGAHVRRGGADDDVAAVGALPDAVAVAGEDEAAFDVGEEFAVALFVFLFDGAHHAELGGDFGEAFGIGLGGHAVVHVGPFEVLAVGRVLQVLGRGGDAAVQVLEPDFSVFFLVGGGLFEDLGDLDVAVFLGLGGVEGVLVTGHGLPGECFQEVLFGLGSFQVHIDVLFCGFKTTGISRYALPRP